MVDSIAENSARFSLLEFYQKFNVFVHATMREFIHYRPMLNTFCRKIELQK